MVGHAPKILLKSILVQMFTTKTIMKITIERAVVLVIIFATVIDAHVPKNAKAEPKYRTNKTKYNTRVDVDKATPTKRDIEDFLTEDPMNMNNIAGIIINEPFDLSELLNEKLKSLIGEDDSTKLEFIKNIKEVLGVNSYENKEDDAIEALRGGDNAEYAMEDYIGGSNTAGNLATLGFAGHAIPNRLLLSAIYQSALRRGLLSRRFNRFYVNKPKSYQRTVLRNVVQTQPTQAKLLIPEQKNQATSQQKQSNVQQFQVTQSLENVRSLPLQRLETETVILLNMNHQEIQKPVFDSNDNAYPYEGTY